MRTKPYWIIPFLFIPLTVYAELPVVDLASIAQLTMVVDKLDQLKAQTQYLKQELDAIKTLRSNQYQWGNVSDLINQLGENIEEANGIAYSAQNLGEQFKATFPGFQAPDNYSQQYQNIVQKTNETLEGVLQSSGESARDFSHENSRLAFLQQQAQNAQGQTQAIQAASQIASEEVNQTELLRQAVIAQTNAETTYYAADMQTKASQQAEFTQVIQAGSQEIPPYGTSGSPIIIPDHMN
jgi:P-type conjugative transfer protein TrbJ